MKLPAARTVRTTLASAAFVLAALPLQAAAQQPGQFQPVPQPRESSPAYGAGAGTWGNDAKATSAALARDGWKFLALSTMSWPDGSQAVVTVWQSKLGDYARCFDYFTPDMKQAGGKCERSGTGI